MNISIASNFGWGKTIFPINGGFGLGGILGSLELGEVSVRVAARLPEPRKKF